MHPLVMDLRNVSRADIALVGGKAANLGELSRIEGVRVPDGLCVTTAAFQQALGMSPVIAAQLDALARLSPDDTDAIRAVAATLRAHIEALPLTEDLQSAIQAGLVRLGEARAYAVRSSATAEDGPTASFAGQQDSALNVVGLPAILAQIRQCWASLFTERAIHYRLQQGLPVQAAHMAVVVQHMLSPSASGVLFTADPIGGDRRVVAIEAAPGLGDALVAGRVHADAYQVRDDQIIDRKVRAKPALTDAQIRGLARLGRQVEAHFGQPMDIEWCLVDDAFQLVQARPITTLYPIPETAVPGKHVYISVGHQQMMTDPMKPLGLSLFQATAGRPMFEAGGRLFVDVTNELSTPTGRAALLNGLGRADPLIHDALTTLLDRGEIPLQADAPPGPGRPAHFAGGPPTQGDDDPAIVAELIARTQASIAALEAEISLRAGPELLDFIGEDLQSLKRSLMDPQSFGAILAGMNAVTWLNEHMLGWLGEKGAADVLSQSAPNNVTSEMGLALLDVADAIRPWPEVVATLERARAPALLERLLPLPGGPEACAAIRGFLDRYGMRCVGEIDITRKRWREAPEALVPLILSNIRNFEPGAAARSLERGRQAAEAKERDLLDRLSALPEGEQKVIETQRVIRRLRNFIGYREFPKYGIVCRYAIYKQALLAEAERLVHAGLLRHRDDIDYLTLTELGELLRDRSPQHERIARRKAEHERNGKLRPPRVLTSDGELLAGAYRRDGLPAGALVGLGVSAGVAEGRARVLSDLADARLEPGDILVTAFTDPSWTPAFVSIRGLVTEVGGLMTHGAVIAREYGLPAVVNVENATRLIQDGQRIRVHGGDGIVEILG